MITRKVGRPSLDKCFAAGTPVLTPDGVQRIETLRPGDRVVSVGETPNARRIASIVAVHQSAARRTIRLVAGGEAVVTTEGHPFATFGRRLDQGRRLESR